MGDALAGPGIGNVSHLSFGSRMRHSICTPLPISLLPRRMRAPPAQRCLVACLRRAARRHVCFARTLPSAVALPAITRCANQARHVAARADESPQRIDSHENLDGGLGIVRALLRSLAHKPWARGPEVAASRSSLLRLTRR